MTGPARLVLELVTLAIVVGAGLAYGNHWKRQVLAEDGMLLELYRKVDQLEERNQQLLQEIRNLESRLPAG